MGYQRISGIAETTAAAAKKTKENTYKLLLDLGNLLWGKEKNVMQANRLPNNDSSLLNVEPKSPTGLRYFNPFSPAIGWQAATSQPVYLQTQILFGQDQEKWKALPAAQRAEIWKDFQTKLKFISDTDRLPLWPEPDQSGQASINANLSDETAQYMWNKGAGIENAIYTTWKGAIETAFAVGPEPPFLFVSMSPDATVPTDEAQKAFDNYMKGVQALKTAAEKGGELAKDLAKGALKLGWGSLKYLWNLYWPWLAGGAAILIGIPITTKIIIPGTRNYLIKRTERQLKEWEGDPTKTKQIAKAKKKQTKRKAKKAKPKKKKR